MPFEVTTPAQSTAELNPGPGWPLVSAAEFILERAVPEGISGAAVEDALAVAVNQALGYLEARNLEAKPLSTLEERDFLGGVFWLALGELVPRYPRFFSGKGAASLGATEAEEAEDFYLGKGQDRLRRIEGFAQSPVIGVHGLGPTPSPRDPLV